MVQASRQPDVASIIAAYLAYPIETHNELAKKLGRSRAATTRLIGRARKRLNASESNDAIRGSDRTVISLTGWNL